MSTNLEEIRIKGDQVAIYNNPAKNRTLIIRNKIKDFDCTNEILIIWTVSGGVLFAKADFDYPQPNLKFNSLTSMGSSLENYNFVSKIACGESHCLLLTTSGFWYAFGNGWNGRLGLGDTDGRDEPSMIYNLLDFTVESIHATNSWSFAVWKIRNGIPVPITHKLANGETVTTVIDSEKNVVYSWGKGDSGCLGSESEDDIISPQPLTLSIDENISSIVTGKNHVFAVNTEKDKVYAWGNYYNELVNFITATKTLKGNPKLFNSRGLAVGTLKAKHERVKENGKSDNYTSFYPNNSNHYVNAYDIDLKGPLEIHDEMKKQNKMNKIEIKTLDEEDLEEMNDWEIEVEDDDIIHEENKDGEAIEFEKLPNSDTKGNLYGFIL